MNMLIIFLKLVSFITLSEAENVFYFQPEQIHIAFGENVSEIMVNWSTKDFTDSIVEYGINGLWKRAEGNSTKFVDGGPLKASQFIHRVTLKNLENSSRYVYHCGSDLGWSDMLYFHTVPNGSDWAPRLAVYGDMGNENPQSLPRLQQDVVHHRYDMVLHVGDFGYDMHDENGAVGDEFMRQIQPIAAHVPYMVAVGNHEAAYNFSHYKARFSMPRTSDNMFYSFDLGPAHFIGFSTEVYYDTWISSESHIASMVQYERLENDLKEATKPENRSKRPWIITFGHRPMYCSNSDRDDCTHSESRVRTGFQDQKGYGLEDLFYKYGVDLELWAHEHSYERLWPVYNHQVYNGSWNLPYTNPRAPVHIITGSAGCKEKIDGFMDNPRGWSAFRSSDYGYTRMQVHNATHLYLEQVSDDLDGDIIDHVWLIKNKHGPYALHEEM